MSYYHCYVLALIPSFFGLIFLDFFFQGERNRGDRQQTSEEVESEARQEYAWEVRQMVGTRICLITYHVIINSLLFHH